MRCWRNSTGVVGTHRSLNRRVGRHPARIVERHYFLDLETGEVLMFMEELRYAEEPPDWSLPEWQREWVEKAKEVWAGYGTRYIQVPEADSHAAYRDMEDFIVTVEDQYLQELLWVAIEGRGAFGRFRGVLAAHPRERKRWFAFSDERLRRRILDWLASEGIEPITEEEPAQEEETGEPTDRELFLGETLAFVREVARMRGVQRIALLGSLTTEKPEPRAFQSSNARQLKLRATVAKPPLRAADQGLRRETLHA